MEPIMHHKESLVLIFISSLLLVGCGASGTGSEPTAQQQKNIAERIAPIGKVIMANDISVSTSVISSAVVEKVILSEGSEHTVKMLNAGEGGNMIFEPAVLKVSLGDTIHFKAVDMSHNSATIDGLIPEGAADWSGAINEDISVTLNAEGIYVYQCDPHAMMAMVGVIQVGDAVNMAEINEAAETFKSNFMLNTDRLEGYLARL
jgi:pseudoazurin